MLLYFFCFAFVYAAAIVQSSYHIRRNLSADDGMAATCYRIPRQEVYDTSAKYGRSGVPLMQRNTRKNGLRDMLLPSLS